MAMTVGRITVCGQEYPACLSSRVIINIKKRSGEADFIKGINAILGDGDVEGMFWLLAEMLTAGKRYMKLIGEDTPEPPCEDDLLDLIGINEYGALVKVITDTATETGTPEITLEGDSKNLETTTPTA